MKKMGYFNPLKMEENVMLTQLFKAHGQLCASRPWEVIIGTVTLTVCVMSMSLFAFNSRLCGWNYKCIPEEEDVMSSDLLVLTITRCLAIMYIYLQFRNLRKLGSKYLLGIAGVFTIFSSFVFSIGVINLVGSDLTGLNEALPFFLLLVDLAKASALARFALSSRTQDEVVDNIGRGMAVLGPAITLDAMVETLVIGVGTLSGVRRLETMCCFGCLSVLVNYIAFMTFYPACLALVVELSRERNQGRPGWQLQQLAKVLQEEEEQKSNPVTQRIKIIMSAGLVFVHAHSRWLTGQEDTSLDLLSGNTGHDSLMGDRLVPPDGPLWLFFVKKATSIDYTLAMFLGMVLSVKYIMFDSDVDLEELSKREGPAPAVANTSGDRQLTASVISGDPPITANITSVQQPIASTGIVTNSQQITDTRGHDVTDSVPVTRRAHKSSFTIGEESSEESDQEELVAPPAKEMASIGTQTTQITMDTHCGPTRPVQECLAILKSEAGPEHLSDDEILLLVRNKHIPSYKLQTVLGDHIRGVSMRRTIVTEGLVDKEALNKLPYDNYDYSYVEGACCENVVGYMPVPVGVAGPLLLDGQKYTVPMATTEGCLVASTNRGCRALLDCGGVRSTVISNNMTRAPVVRFPSAKCASQCKLWLEKVENFNKVAETFNSTSRFARLQKLHAVQAAKNLYIRFVAGAGDAMGMNMVSKGSEKALTMLQEEYFPDMETLSLSGNFCTDKKPSAVNWIEGRGKSVVCEAIIPSHTIQNVLKTSVHALVDLNISKNLMGSALAGSIGGFNAHAANMVTAIFIATGQDPAQNVCSSNCMTIMEATGVDHQDLYISCTMPSIEVGTIGGGTVLPPQAACLQMLGVRGANPTEPGINAATLARIVCGTVLAGELSLMSALAAGHLVRSHLQHNRSVINMAATSPVISDSTSTTDKQPIKDHTTSQPIKGHDTSPIRPIRDNERSPIQQRQTIPGTCIQH